MRQKSILLRIISLILLISLTGCASNDTTAEANNSVSIIVPDYVDSDFHKPTKDEVLDMREKCLSGMVSEDINTLKEWVVSQNKGLEYTYLYENNFAKYEDPDDLIWNLYEQTGDEVLIGYAFDPTEKESKYPNMSEDEYAIKYGSPVTTHNDYAADDYINIISSIKNTVQCEEYQKEFDKLIADYTAIKDSHDVKYLRDIFHIYHDMDYYLLRYAPDDFSDEIIEDTSLINTYYNSLDLYKISINAEATENTSSPTLSMEEAWNKLYKDSFNVFDLNEITYNENGYIEIVIFRNQNTSYQGKDNLTLENTAFLDHEDDEYYYFGNYDVFYEKEEVFTIKTLGWYKVNKYTGDIEKITAL